MNKNFRKRYKMKKIISLLLVTMMCISLCACGGSGDSSTGNGGIFKEKKEIEITMDNWQEYFEIKYDIETVELQKNAFDEIEDVQLRNSGTKFCLKEEYIDSFVNADIAVEINTNQAVATLIKYNFESKTYEIIECLEDNGSTPFYEMVYNCSNKTHMKEVTDFEGELARNMTEFDRLEENDVYIYILMYPNSEVTRIQGKLVIKE